MMLRILFFLVFFGVSSFAGAADLNPLSPQSVRGGFDILKLEGPDATRRERFSFNTSYHHLISDQLRAEAYLLISPDDLKKSGKVNIDTDYYQLLPAVAWTYSYFFRYAAAIGPGFILGRTSYQIGGQKESFTFYDTSINGRFHLEYAINRRFEINGTIGTQFRFAEQRLDWSYGTSLSFYF